MSLPAVETYWSAILHMGQAYGIDPFLIAAFIETESGGIPQKTRYEKDWRFYNMPEVNARELGISLETEKMAQSHSYGLLQIIGATARDVGYKGYLVDLCQPETGLEYGCKYLAARTAKYPDRKDMISSYNMGTPRKAPSGLYVNQHYVDTVIINLAAFKGVPHG